MAFSTVLLITLAAGAVLVVGGGLMVYVSALVKSAYEIKVQLNNEVDEKLTKMVDDLDKKARWIKRDLLEEIEKIKIAVQSDNARKLAELSEPVLMKLGELERLIADHRDATIKAIEADRQSIAGIESRLRMVMRAPAKKAEDEPPAGAAATLDEAAAILAARAAVGVPAAAGKPAEATVSDLDAKSDSPS